MRATECFSMYSDMSRRMMARSSSNKKFRESTREFRLSHACRAEKEERANRAIRIAQAGAVAANRVRDARKRRILADHALAQPLFHVDQLLDFAFEQTADGNSGPLADDLRDLFLADFFLQHRMIFLQFGEAVLRGLQFLFSGGQLAVANFRHACEVAGALVALFFGLQLVDLLL